MTGNQMIAYLHREFGVSGDSGDPNFAGDPTAGYWLYRQAWIVQVGVTETDESKIAESPDTLLVECELDELLKAMGYAVTIGMPVLYREKGWAERGR